MGYRALLLDFYGTLVTEDDAIIERIVRRVAEASQRGSDAAAIATDWNQEFQKDCANSFGSTFSLQRKIDTRSLGAVLERHASPLDADELSAELFAYWSEPEPFADAGPFLSALELPVCVVSNIDRADLDSAIRRSRTRLCARGHERGLPRVQAPVRDVSGGPGRARPFAWRGPPRGGLARLRRARRR